MCYQGRRQELTEGCSYFSSLLSPLLLPPFPSPFLPFHFYPYPFPSIPTFPLPPLPLSLPPLSSFSLSFPPLPLEVGPLNHLWCLGSAVSYPIAVKGGSQAEIEFGAL